MKGHPPSENRAPRPPRTDVPSAYRDAGVDIDAQDAALERVGALARSTFTEGVLAGLGGFGGLFRPDLEGYEEPVLVASADGVGTKLTVARLAGDYSTVGRDLVNHCVNDLLTQGAKPLFFLDYVGAGVLDPDQVVQLVEGVARGCRENGCALLGGETAEMPGFYRPGDYELVGFAVALVERCALLGAHRVRPGDLLVGLASAGLHTNGFSLARRVFFETMGLGLEDPVPEIEPQTSLRQVLLAPHRSYLRCLEGLLRHPALHALAHITGGGITDNLPRILPPGCHAEVRVGSWRIPDLFRLLERRGAVEGREMFRVFNMGVGMIAAVAADGTEEALAHLCELGEKAWILGTVEEGGEGVVYLG